ncbi:isopeptide-forming domain-containing fimbrial protein [Bilifractor porci]|uniref:Isopeptide-forming domain-containing fimbrial protein n=1 Tax=Bilifractor porci TaxID=2606636 RepID=A0A7X2P6S5_9FIRM|nr:isopeptide-forming domain-containing fimbrial protein [Bilifractor porci]MST81110.1 isopeptide-forming domain-containing fimbrial protein [Bilifractor porci]
MKKLKKAAGVLLALALALVTLLGTGTAVRAEDTASTTTGNSLTITNTGATEHTFELYQIFTGTYGDGTLGNIEWGSGVTTKGQAAYEAADKAKSLVNEADAKAFADELIDKGYLTTPTTSKVVASSGTYTFENLAAGYYLVIDKAKSQNYDPEKNNQVNGASTSYIIQVVGGKIESKTKIQVPEIEKKVADANNSIEAAVTDPLQVDKGAWKDAADYDIGDSIPYRITGTLPSNYGDYKTYKTYTITDTFSEGLTPPTRDLVTVRLESNDSANQIQSMDITENFDITVSGQTLTVALKSDKDMKNITKNSSDKIVVYYNAKLNEKAIIGATGNPNTVNLQYSNNPNQGGSGEKGKTPDDTNIVFTYELDVNKFKDNNSDENKTNEANFKLYKELSDGNVKEISIAAGIDDKTYTAKGLDDGTYILQETEAPNGYNRMEGSVNFGEKSYDNAFEFQIETEKEDGMPPKLTSIMASKTGQSSDDITEDATSGKISTDIIDQKGSSLPTTGGIGTTIFYVIGSVLVIGAGVLLITRRRMNKKS